ncbi:MMS19 nucleotide excision repair protein homolog isoform X2 [Argentina anserina]|nr:MMS19 nucleotide excision repair protein homolog isoform X2 [Potentilla anserina]
MVSASDAKFVAQSFRENLPVQSLAQQDRKLCFELLECLLQHYPNEVASLGEDLFYAISEAIDGEKDPHCLILTFHIVEILVQIYPEPSGPLASFCGDLFEFLGCYFPIHFTHLKDEDADVRREDLSKALMSAFSSTALFEPFVIPLLLEKLSSSLPLAKVDSLKYLNYCASRYGAERMAKHAETIWVSLKHEISNSLKVPAKSFPGEPLLGLGFEEDEIVTEALILLQKVTMQNDALFLRMIVQDADINNVFNSIATHESYTSIPSLGRQSLHAVGRIFCMVAGTSMASCSRIFERFFPSLMKTLEISLGISSKDCTLKENSLSSRRFNIGALYLCMELIAACRDLIMRTNEHAEKSGTADETCCYMLQSSAPTLITAFCTTLAKSSNNVVDDAEIYFKVKGLQMLVTFPGYFLQIPKPMFENVLKTLMSIILVNFDNPMLWKLALKALVHIGSFVDMHLESEEAQSYTSFVVEKTISLVSQDDFIVPFPLKLEAVSEIGTSSQNHMLKIVQGLEDAIVANLSKTYVHGDSKSAEKTIQLLECYYNKIISWINETGGLEEVLYRFVIRIWNCIERCKESSSQVQDKGLLDATMMATKLAVGSCSEESQNIIIQKAYRALSSGLSIPFKDSMDGNSLVKLENLHLSEQLDMFSPRDELILSLFASVIIGMRPKSHIANAKGILHLFMTALVKGCAPAAQALGSMINKLGTPSNEIAISTSCTLEEAMEIIFRSKLWNISENGVLRESGTGHGSKVGLTELCLGISISELLQIHAITGIAWIGKGLLLIGHERVKDVTKIILDCLMADERVGASVRRTAADAFHILMSDCDVCLNRTFHAKIRPLYKQRFFSTVMPILHSLIVKSDSPLSRPMLFRASAHLISNAPLIVILSEAKKLMKVLLDGLSILSEDILDNDKLYSLLLVLSGILTDKCGEEAVLENAHIIIDCLTRLINYPHMMLVRETAIQCLLAMSGLPRPRIFPLKTQVLQAIFKALDDPKRSVRQEAVRCRHAWTSIA